MTKWNIAFFVLCAINIFLFGNPLKPLPYLLGIWRIPVSPSLLGWAAVGGFLAAISGAFLMRALVPKQLARDATPTASLILAVFTAVTILSVATNAQRQRTIANFAPDQVHTKNFIDSLRNTPSDFQQFLHAAAIKNCKPYAWSYSKMRFYDLPRHVAVNVLPKAWIEECGISRDQTPSPPAE